jgi:hypothetical protein
MRVHCPACGAANDVSSDLIGQEIYCRSCPETFRVHPPARGDEPLPLPVDDARRRSFRREPADEAPMYRPRRSEYDDEPQRPSPIGWIIGGIVAALLFVIGLGGFIWLRLDYTRSTAAAPTPTAMPGSMRQIGVPIAVDPGDVLDPPGILDPAVDPNMILVPDGPNRMKNQVPLVAIRGARFDFQLDRNGRGRCKLVSGPKGMTVSADGQILWEVPDDQPNGMIDVSIVGTDPQTGEMAYRLRLSVVD